MNKDEVSGWEREKAAAWYWNSNKVEATNHTAGKSIAQSVRDIWTKLPIPPTISDRILIIFRIFFAAHMRSLLCWGCWHVPVSWCDYIVIGEYFSYWLSLGKMKFRPQKWTFFYLPMLVGIIRRFTRSRSMKSSMKGESLADGELMVFEQKPKGFKLKSAAILSQ